MSVGGELGTVVVSIDLELDLEHDEPEQQRRLDAVRVELVELTRQFGVAATWAVADPMLSAATESILAAGCGHEIAVLGDQAWLGPGCGRQRLARELARRFSAARKAGIFVRTLALRNVEQLVDLDLLVSHDVKAVCGPAVDLPPPRGRVSAGPIRFGLWEPPAAWRLPPRGKWWSPVGWQIGREIKRAIRQGALLHLRLDAVRLVDSLDGAMELVAGVFGYLAAKRDAALLSIETIGHLAEQALALRTSAPSQSILRRVA